MEKANEIETNKNKGSINYKELFKISINEEHKCVAIHVSAGVFRKQKDYSEFYREVD